MLREKNESPLTEINPAPDSMSESMEKGLKMRIEGQFARRSKTAPKRPVFDKKASEMAEIDIEKVVGMAKKASSDFFLSKIPLNESIAKIAGEQGLNGDQVQRLVEAANMITYQSLYKMATEDKNVVFELAEKDAIMAKLADSALDRDIAPVLPTKETLVSTDFTKPPGQVMSYSEKTAAEKPEPKKIEKSANEIAQETMKKYAHAKVLHETMPRFTEMVKSAMIEGESFKKVSQFDRFMHIAKIAHDINPSEYQPVIEKVASYLCRIGFLSKDQLLKVAAALENESLLPEYPKSMTVNGDHMIVKTLRAMIGPECCGGSSDNNAIHPKTLRIREMDSQEQ